MACLLNVFAERESVMLYVKNRLQMMLLKSIKANRAMQTDTHGEDHIDCTFCNIATCGEFYRHTGFVPDAD